MDIYRYIRYVFLFYIPNGKGTLVTNSQLTLTLV